MLWAAIAEAGTPAHPGATPFVHPFAIPLSFAQRLGGRLDVFEAYA